MREKQRVRRRETKTFQIILHTLMEKREIERETFMEYKTRKRHGHGPTENEEKERH